MSRGGPERGEAKDRHRPLRIAADVGGTFTDIAHVTDDGTVACHKLPSTTGSYASAVVNGVNALCESLTLDLGKVQAVLHGCTVATNAILERKGARTALLTTRGFRDVLELRRIRVPRLYDPLWQKPEPLVPRHLRFEITERSGPDGSAITPLADHEVERCIDALRDLDVEAIAVSFLHAYANPRHEAEVGGRLRDAFPGRFVTLSTEILPEIREYERTSTAVINAYVGPPMQRYVGEIVERLAEQGVGGRLMIMQSSGGMLDAATTMAQPARVIECGPAAGVIGALHLGRMTGFGDLITLDMGGTTAKASTIEGGRLLTTDEYEVGGGISLSSRLVKGGGYALKTPVIDISEVGAGGGSIVWLDKAGQIKVGPQSAGAVPGPAGYGAGGVHATVTDANIVLGYLNAEALAGGTVPIQAGLSRRAVEEQVAGPLGRGVLESAYGIHTIANANMMRAVKSVSTYRGRDPRDFTLLAFGGNGGIHGPELARALGMRKVIVPPAAGVFSAVGLLFADIEMTRTRAFLHRLDALDPADIEAAFRELETAVIGELRAPPEQVRISRHAAARYVGQAFELVVPIDLVELRKHGTASIAKAFEAEHERTYGHRFPGARAVQTVSLHVAGALATLDRVAYAARGNQSHRSGNGKAPPQRDAYFGPPHGILLTPVLSRDAIGATARRGPLIIEDYDATTVVPPNSTACVDAFGNIIVELSAPDGAA
jgi:N-methylhydantoinase A